MNIKRLKEKRKTLHSSFTKLLTKIENSLSLEKNEQYSKDVKIEQLMSLKAQLTEKLNELTKIDEEIQEKIVIDDLPADVSLCEEYKEKGIDTKTKLDLCLNSLTTTSHNVIPVSSSDEQVGIELRNKSKNILKLPKLEIAKFYGDCSQWLDFWNSYE